MKILVVNAGSASIKLAAYELTDHDARVTARVQHDPGDAEPEALLNGFVAECGTSPDAACHRVVHGGQHLTGPCLLTRAVEQEIQRLADLAPLHNPVAYRWIRACRAVLGEHRRQVAVFDTSFYTGLPAVAAAYAIPRSLANELGIRRYGFHGIAHRAMWERWCHLRRDLPQGGRFISIQLGGGCSMTAVRNGRPQDTSMGFSPLEGLVMASRSGDVDPSVVTYLMRKKGLSAEAVDHLLNHESGLEGLSLKSSDIRLLLSSDEKNCRTAVELYCYRVRKYLGAYMAVLGGADGVVFGGGVGEHAPRIRELVMSAMGWCGIMLDGPENNAAVGKESRISQPSSTVEVWIIPVDEASVMAREAYKVITEA